MINIEELENELKKDDNQMKNLINLISSLFQKEQKILSKKYKFGEVIAVFDFIKSEMEKKG